MKMLLRPSLILVLTTQKRAKWVDHNAIKILNVAGPRASKDPDIYNTTTKILETMLAIKKETDY